MMKKRIISQLGKKWMMQHVMWENSVTSARQTIIQSLLWPMRPSGIWVLLPFQPHLITLLSLNHAQLVPAPGLWHLFCLSRGACSSIVTSSEVVCPWQPAQIAPSPSHQALANDNTVSLWNDFVNIFSVFLTRMQAPNRRVLISSFLTSPHGLELLALPRGLRNVYMCVYLYMYIHTHIFVYIHIYCVRIYICIYIHVWV